MATSKIYQRYRQYYSYIQPILADPVVRTYFGLIASILLVAFLLVFALSPTVNIILGLQKKIADQNESVAALSTKINNLVAAQQTYAQIEMSLPLLDQALPAFPAPEEVIDRLHRSASASGVAISGLQFKNIPLSNFENTLQAVEFSLSVSGARTAVRDFLGRAENQLRYIRIGSLVFGTDVHVEGKGYYFPSEHAP